jgi:hypothetical protein
MELNLIIFRSSNLQQVKSNEASICRGGFILNQQTSLNLKVMGLYKHPVAAAQLICDVTNFAVAGTVTSCFVLLQLNTNMTQPIPTYCHRPVQVMLILFAYCGNVTQSSVLLSLNIWRKLLSYEMCLCRLVERRASL